MQAFHKLLHVNNQGAKQGQSICCPIFYQQPGRVQLTSTQPGEPNNQMSFVQICFFSIQTVSSQLGQSMVEDCQKPCWSKQHPFCSDDLKSGYFLT